MTSREAFEAHIQAKTGERPQIIGGFDTNLRWREDWEIWQAAYEAGRTAEREECAKVCDEMRDHWSDYIDTALLNGDVALSNAASGEPRAAEFLAKAIRARGKP